MSDTITGFRSDNRFRINQLIIRHTKSQQMKASLEKYGLSICWRARSVSARILVGLSMVGMVQSFSDYGFRAAGLSSIPGSR